MARLALLGLTCGVAAGALMLGFRWMVESLQSLFRPGGNSENHLAGMLATIAAFAVSRGVRPAPARMRGALIAA